MQVDPHLHLRAGGRQRHASASGGVSRNKWGAPEASASARWEGGEVGGGEVGRWRGEEVGGGEEHGGASKSSGAQAILLLDKNPLLDKYPLLV